MPKFGDMLRYAADANIVVVYLGHSERETTIRLDDGYSLNNGTDFCFVITASALDTGYPIHGTAILGGSVTDHWEKLT